MTHTRHIADSVLPAFRAAAAWLRDRRGVAAVEFAFVVPLLLCMYFITMEASQGIEVNKKVSRIGSATADLITQQSEIKASEVMAIMKIAGSVIQPYNRSRPTLEVTAIQLGTEPTPIARVAWSLKLNSSGAAVAVTPKNTIVSVPAQIRVAGAFYIQSTSKLAYQPVITWSADAARVGLFSAFNNISMGETFYLRPRISTTIPCNDCP